MKDTEGENFLESNSSFVPAATANPGASRVAPESESNSGGFEGKVVMTYEQLKATGALTPVKPHDSAPFASPTTKRTQRAAAKLAERRKTTSPKELVGSGVIGGNNGGGEEQMEPTPTYTTNFDAPKAGTSSNRNGAVNLDSDFSEEKSSTRSSTTTTATARRSNNGKSNAANCFASPPLSGATSAGRRRFVSSQQKSSGAVKKGANSSRRSINGTATSPSIGEDGDSRTPLKTLPLSVQREMERKKDTRELAASKSGTDPNFDSRPFA